MLRLDIPITKIDVRERLVYGTAKFEVPDRAGEVADYDSSKPLYAKWAASDDLRWLFGPRRLGELGPHQAGRHVGVTYNDEARLVELACKVEDDSDWAAVRSGVYTAFVQNGCYARRWTDERGATRYTVDPFDLRLADLPVGEEARFELIQADGSRAWRHSIHAGRIAKPLLIAAPVTEDLAILLKPGFVGTVTVRRPGARPMVTATADVWPFVATGPLAKFWPPRGDT